MQQESSCEDLTLSPNKLHQQPQPQPQPTPFKPSFVDSVSLSFTRIVFSAANQIRSSMSGEPIISSSGATLLGGSTYPSPLLHNQAVFLAHFTSMPWMTYRLGFPPIKPSNFQSDVGWGCMLRSGQMLLANALILHFLGKDWRLGAQSNNAQYIKILLWFLDSNTAPFSIHRIALLGKQYDKEIGEWFGPSTISQVLRILVEGHKECNMALYVASDGVIFKDELKAAVAVTSSTANESTTAASSSSSSSSSFSWKPVLILVPIRLGVDRLNAVYIPGLKSCFAARHCVGVAGGKPNSSYFFVGYSGEQAIYLDPHFMRPAVKLKDTSSYTLEDLESYRCSQVRTVAITSLDPSMVLGFYCRNQHDFEDFCVEAIKSTMCGGRTPLFSIEETTPNYDGGGYGGFMSDEDEEDEKEEDLHFI